MFHAFPLFVPGVLLGALAFFCVFLCAHLNVLAQSETEKVPDSSRMAEASLNEVKPSMSDVDVDVGGTPPRMTRPSRLRSLSDSLASRPIRVPSSHSALRPAPFSTSPASTTQPSTITTTTSTATGTRSRAVTTTPSSSSSSSSRTPPSRPLVFTVPGSASDNDNVLLKGRSYDIAWRAVKQKDLNLDVEGGMDLELVHSSDQGRPVASTSMEDKQRGDNGDDDVILAKLATGLSASSSGFSWTVPESGAPRLPNGHHYRLRLVTTSPANSAAASSSSRSGAVSGSRANRSSKDEMRKATLLARSDMFSIRG